MSQQYLLWIKLKSFRRLDISTPAILSIFAGRIADTGTDPSKIISEALELSKKKSKTEILWASTRETLNIYQADI